MCNLNVLVILCRIYLLIVGVIEDLLAIILSVQNRSSILQYAWVAAD